MERLRQRQLRVPGAKRCIRVLPRDQLEGVNYLRLMLVLRPQLAAAAEIEIPAAGNLIVVDTLRRIGVERARIQIETIRQLSGIGCKKVAKQRRKSVVPLPFL